jgi:streptomycin 6-kinase
MSCADDGVATKRSGSGAEIADWSENETFFRILSGDGFIVVVEEVEHADSLRLCFGLVGDGGAEEGSHGAESAFEKTESTEERLLEEIESLARWFWGE